MSNALALTTSALTGAGTFTFTYTDLEPETARAVRDAAAGTRTILHSAYLEAGRQLTAVKKLLPHGQFTAWAEAELGMTARTTQNFMAASSFVEDKPETVSLLPAATLYRLAAPSAPPEVVREVVAAAAANTPLDAALINQRLKAVRQEAAERKNALSQARRRNPEATAEEVEARWEKKHRRRQAREDK